MAIVYEGTEITTCPVLELKRNMKRYVGRTKVRAAPFVFFSPPSSKLHIIVTSGNKQMKGIVYALFATLEG
jgi:hypothetical protein